MTLRVRMSLRSATAPAASATDATASATDLHRHAFEKTQRCLSTECQRAWRNNLGPEKREVYNENERQRKREARKRQRAADDVSRGAAPPDRSLAPSPRLRRPH